DIYSYDENILLEVYTKIAQKRKSLFPFLWRCLLQAENDEIWNHLVFVLAYLHREKKCPIFSGNLDELWKKVVPGLLKKKKYYILAKRENSSADKYCYLIHELSKAKGFSFMAEQLSSYYKDILLGFMAGLLSTDHFFYFSVQLEQHGYSVIERWFDYPLDVQERVLRSFFSYEFSIPYFKTFFKKLLSLYLERSHFPEWDMLFHLLHDDRKKLALLLESIKSIKRTSRLPRRLWHYIALEEEISFVLKDTDIQTVKIFCKVTAILLLREIEKEGRGKLTLTMIPKNLQKSLIHSLLRMYTLLGKKQDQDTGLFSYLETQLRILVKDHPLIFTKHL
ncbi:MAG: hypothetical protein D6785_02515, partial [Planctomycetota bacterium]